MSLADQPTHAPHDDAAEQPVADGSASSASSSASSSPTDAGLAQHGRGPRFRPRTALIIGALFVVVTLVMVRPTPGGLESLPENLGDPVLVTWILRYGAHALTNDPTAVFDAPIFWPHGDTFAYSESMLPLAPVYGAIHAVVGDEIVAFNLLVIGFYLFNLVTTYALAHYVLRDRTAAVISALAFSFTGYVMARAGHPHLQPVGVFSLGFLALVRMLDAPCVRRGVLAGLANAVAFLTVLYYGAIWAVCMAIVIVGWLAWQRFRVSRAAVVAFGVMAAVSAALILPVAMVYDRRGLERPLVPRWGLNIRDLVTTREDSYLYGWASSLGVTDERIEHTYFPGVITTVLAIVGLLALVGILRRQARGRRVVEPTATPAEAPTAIRADVLTLVALAGAASVVLAIGPDFAGMPAPQRFFHEHVPGFSGIRVTSRLAVPGLLAGALLAGLGAREVLRRTSGRATSFGAVGLGALILLEFAAPVPRVDFDRSDAAMAVYEELDRRPSGPVVELPIINPAENGYDWAFVEAPRMLRATTDWNPRVNGYSGDFPPDYISNARVLNRFPGVSALKRAKLLGVRYVVLHTSELGSAGSYPEAEAEEMIAQLPPNARAERFGDAWLVELDLE